MGIVEKIKLFFKGGEEVAASQTTKVIVRRPVTTKTTEDYIANKELTKGLYFNTYPGFKLGAGLVYPMISIPIFFMGFPIVKSTPISENDSLSDEIDLIMQNFQSDLFKFHKNLHIECHREGTIYAYPRFNAETRKPEIEIISDNTVVRIRKNINTGEPIALYTDEEISIATDIEHTEIVRRQRVFTKERIEIRYLNVPSDMSDQLQNESMINVAGILPIPFANNADSDEIRGHSDIERVISIIKSYHDISFSEQLILAKFSAKMIQNVKNADDWKKNNDLDSLADYDVKATDLILNIEGESTDFIFPEGAIANAEQALRRLFRLIVETSGVPEIVWGIKTEGNANTAEEQMATLLKFVNDKRIEKNDPYKVLFSAILRLLSIANGRDYDRELEITWNQLSEVSLAVQAEIFRNFSDGVFRLLDGAGITKDQLFRLWQQWYPNATQQDFDTFVIELDLTGRLKQWRDASLEEANQDRGLDGFNTEIA